MTSNPKSWRDELPIHPAADLLPMMSEPELLELGQDILKRCLLEGVALFDGQLLDGRNRLDAMEKANVRLVVDGQLDRNIPHRNVRGCDPVAYVLSKNIHRRHLTNEQRLELISKLVTATPEKSDRQIAEQAQASPTTVGKIRKKLETTGRVSTVDTRTDKGGRKQQAHKRASMTRAPIRGTAVMAAADRAEARAAEQKATPKPEPPPAPQLEAPELAAVLAREAQKDAHIAELEAARDAAPSVESVLDDLIGLTHRNPCWINGLPIDKVYTKAELDNAITQLQLIAKTMMARRGKKPPAKLSITVAGLNLSKAGAAPSREATTTTKD